MYWCHDPGRVSQIHRKGQRVGPTIPGNHRRTDEHEETVAILKGLRERYEEHHRVQITDDAIAAAVEMSERYITARASLTRPST